MDLSIFVFLSNLRIDGKSKKNVICNYSRLIGSRIIESAAYCNQIWLIPLYQNSAEKKSFNWIIRLMCCPKVILQSGGHCTLFF